MIKFPEGASFEEKSENFKIFLTGIGDTGSKMGKNERFKLGKLAIFRKYFKKFMKFLEKKSFEL